MSICQRGAVVESYPIVNRMIEKKTKQNKTEKKKTMLNTGWESNPRLSRHQSDAYSQLENSFSNSLIIHKENTKEINV